MSLSLSRRVEKALATDFFPRHLTGSCLTICEGHESRPDDLRFPALIVYAEDAQTFGDMPRETGVRTVRIRCKLIADTADGRGRLDDWRDKIQEILIDCPHTDELNEPQGIDKRKVPGLHVYDVTHAGEPSDVNETDWEEDLLFDVVCQKM